MHYESKNLPNRRATVVVTSAISAQLSPHFIVKQWSYIFMTVVIESLFDIWQSDIEKQKLNLQGRQYNSQVDIAYRSSDSKVDTKNARVSPESPLHLFAAVLPVSSLSRYTNQPWSLQPWRWMEHLDFWAVIRKAQCVRLYKIITTYKAQRRLTPTDRLLRHSGRPPTREGPDLGWAGSLLPERRMWRCSTQTPWRHHLTLP